jgi:hypothetical protein
MRINNRTHIPWFVFVTVATAAAVWLYLGNFVPARLPPRLALPPMLVQSGSGHYSVGGSPLGLVFGSIAFGIFIFAALFGLRKKFLRLKVGSVESWMRAHIWLTLLTVPLVLLHSGFRLGGPMTILLLMLYAIVMVSGVYGLILQHRTPRLMQERVPVETIFEQIPHVRVKLYAAAEELRRSFDTPGTSKVLAASTTRPPMPPEPLAAEENRTAAAVSRSIAPAVAAAEIAPSPDRESEIAIVDFLDRQVLPYLRSRRGSRTGLGKAQFSDDMFRFVRLHVAEPYLRLVEEIQGWCDERRMLDLQTKLHHWLHAWLFVHVPLSFVLVILTAWHAFVTLFYS